MENLRYKILLIEDNKLDQMAFKQLVEDKKLPYDYTIVGSVSEANNILSSERFGIVISDYSLGDGTAFDIFNLLKDTPIIVVTGAGTEEVAVKAMKAGACDYLIKDVERNYLKAVPITIENAVKHKQTEAKLQLLSGAIMSTDDSVYITDMESKIIFVNKAFCETYGYKEQDIIGKDNNILWIGKAQSQNTRSVFRTRGVGSSWEVGFYHRQKDGSVFPVSLSRSIIRDSSGNEVAVVGIVRDISERILVEDELRSLNQELEKQNRLKSKHAIVVCRQLETPMTEFKNVISNVMAGALGKISPQLMENLELADKNIDKVRGIINEFLDTSQIDASTMKMDITELSLRSVVLQVLKALAPLAAKRGIELESLMPDSELAIDADWDRIVQVLTNLVSNLTEMVPANSYTGACAKNGGTAR